MNASQSGSPRPFFACLVPNGALEAQRSHPAEKALQFRSRLARIAVQQVNIDVNVAGRTVRARKSHQIDNRVPFVRRHSEQYFKKPMGLCTSRSLGFWIVLDTEALIETIRHGWQVVCPGPICKLLHRKACEIRWRHLCPVNVGYGLRQTRNRSIIESDRQNVFSFGLQCSFLCTRSFVIRPHFTRIVLRHEQYAVTATICIDLV